MFPDWSAGLVANDPVAGHVRDYDARPSYLGDLGPWVPFGNFGPFKPYAPEGV